VFPGPRPLRLRAALAILKMLEVDQPVFIKWMTAREASQDIQRREDEIEDDDNRLDLLGMIRSRMQLEDARDSRNGAAAEKD
jgi:hypothetical protein